MSWSLTLRELAILGVAWIGAAFVLLAALGILRMPDLFSRLQAASKAATLGVACLLLAVALHFGEGGPWIRAMVLALFLFLTAPIAAHLIARAGFVTGIRVADETVINEATELGRPRTPR
jgi:multicomponent Na+:H+ antiporter subunit G